MEGEPGPFIGTTAMGGRRVPPQGTHGEMESPVQSSCVRSGGFPRPCSGLGVAVGSGLPGRMQAGKKPRLLK